MQVSSAAEYRQLLQQHRIELDPERRADAIWQAVGAAARGAGGEVPASSRADLLPEVTNLVESPTAVLGTFDEAFLLLPRFASSPLHASVCCRSYYASAQKYLSVRSIHMACLSHEQSVICMPSALGGQSLGTIIARLANVHCLEAVQGDPGDGDEETPAVLPHP